MHSSPGAPKEGKSDENGIIFSTDPEPDKSKSKMMLVTRTKSKEKPASLSLCGYKLPWVDHVDHLGHTLHESGSMSEDMKSKRARFIGESVDMRDTFHFAHPLEKIEAVRKFSFSWYGSNIWDLNSLHATHI